MSADPLDCERCGEPVPPKARPAAGSPRRFCSTRCQRLAEQRRAKRIIKQYLTACHVCGKAGADQLDHVIPLSEGGADDESNLLPIHGEPCHRRKTQAEAERARERRLTGGAA